MNRTLLKLLALLAALALLAGGACTLAEEEEALAPASAASIDNTTLLPDGIYAPDAFSFSGGSGKVTITCPEVAVEDGRAVATLVFSSPRYPYVKVGGVEIEGAHSDSDSAFRVPVRLNADNVVVGMTTAMSQPHEIEYTVRVSIEGATAELPGLVYTSTMPLKYAHEFSVDYFEGGYKLLSVGDGNKYLVVPEGGEAPEGLDAGIRVIRQPLTQVYLAATAAMALFDAVDAIDVIRLSSLQQDSWYIENAVAAMERGDMLYAGKYSEPDYEMLVKRDCDLAIESTMILHTPKVQEMIELLGIPVFIERSSYESHPLGRTEWVKLYAAMVNKEAEAEAFFEGQASVIDALKDFPNTEKTVAFFYISSDGSVVVRNATDYVPGMIEIAGGRYIFSDPLELDSARSSVSITMEDFYNAAVNADFLIYNASIDAPLNSVAELLDKSGLFADFKAVKEGNVWSTDKYLYQATDIVGSLITDLNRMLQGETEGMTFIRRLD